MADDREDIKINKRLGLIKKLGVAVLEAALINMEITINEQRGVVVYENKISENVRTISLADRHDDKILTCLVVETILPIVLLILVLNDNKPLFIVRTISHLKKEENIVESLVSNLGLKEGAHTIINVNTIKHRAADKDAIAINVDNAGEYVSVHTSTQTASTLINIDKSDMRHNNKFMHLIENILCIMVKLLVRAVIVARMVLAKINTWINDGTTRRRN